MTDKALLTEILKRLRTRAELDETEYRAWVNQLPPGGPHQTPEVIRVGMIRSALLRDLVYEFRDLIPGQVGIALPALTERNPP